MTDTTDNGAPEGVTDDIAAALNPETPAPEQESTGADAAAESEAQAETRRRSFQERINEKTRLQREAERTAEAERARAEQAERDAQYWREQAAAVPSPDSEEFEKLVDAALSKREAARQAQEAEAAWMKRQADAAAKYDDYFETVIEGAEKATWVCSPTMAEAIRTSETGADVAYHLAKNPEEARRIAALPDIAQVRELTRLETKLATAPAAPPKTATDAPAPPPKARGSGGQFKVAADTDDFAAFEKAYRGD